MTHDREIHRDFRKAYFGDSQADLDQWAKDATATEARLAELPMRIEKARKDVDALHDVMLDCLKLHCFLAEQRPAPLNEAGKRCKPCADNANASPT